MPDTLKKIWTQIQTDARAEAELVRELCVHPLTARLLVNRGLSDPAKADAFLRPELSQLHDPFGLPDMDKAAHRIAEALANEETIFIHGDYDVDGVTSTALYVRTLTALGGKIVYRVPHRKLDGYDLKSRAIDHAKEQGATLVITSDCGIQAREAVTYANSLGLTVIVTDHHEPGEVLPPAYAVVNPHRLARPVWPQRRGRGRRGVALGVAQILQRAADLTERVIHVTGAIVLTTEPPRISATSASAARRSSRSRSRASPRRSSSARSSRRVVVVRCSSRTRAARRASACTSRARSAASPAPRAPSSARSALTSAGSGSPVPPVRGVERGRTGAGIGAVGSAGRGCVTAATAQRPFDAQTVGLLRRWPRGHPHRIGELLLGECQCGLKRADPRLRAVELRTRAVVAQRVLGERMLKLTDAVTERRPGSLGSVGTLPGPFDLKARRPPLDVRHLGVRHLGVRHL